MNLNLDLNLVRSIVTVLAFVAFIALVLRVWRAANREHYEQAAALPFADEPADSPMQSTNVAVGRGAGNV
jgi:cytochrome c oxidase cbb3-type subunit IV